MGRLWWVLVVWGAVACTAGPEPQAVVPAGDRDITLSVSLTTCADAATDSDGDGLSDLCEFEVARAFAPVLVTQAGGCDWDESPVPGRLAGAYLFGVAPQGGTSVRIAYLPAYHRDCGWSGPKCLLPGTGCAGHAGDSELIALEVRSSGRRWWVTSMVLSAHCFGRRARCPWMGPEELGSATWLEGRPGGAPVLFVASGTHAAYLTRRGCDGGHYALDSCDANDAVYRYPIRWPSQNIGSRFHPIGGDGCITSREVGWESTGVDPARVECIWDEDRPFLGWQAQARGEPPSPYGLYLRVVLGW